MLEIKDTISGMTSADYRERFKAEYGQVLVRYRKLNTIVNAYDEGELDFTPACPISLLVEQRFVMLQYLKILERRARIEHISLEFESEKSVMEVDETIIDSALKELLNPILDNK